MTHLKPAEIIDAAEGASAPGRRRHLEECVRCRDQVRQAATLLNDVRMVDAPEPSPLFWEHFSARVRERVNEEPAPRHWSPWIWAPAGVLAASIAIAIGLSGDRLADRAGIPPTSVPLRAVELSAGPGADDSSWTLVSEVTDGLAWDDAEAAGLAVRPGAAEHAVMELSDDQRQELAHLLQDEMTRLKS